MGHTKQLKIFGVRKQNRHEDFLRKQEREQGGYLPTCPLPIRWRKFRNIF